MDEKVYWLVFVLKKKQCSTILLGSFFFDREENVRNDLEKLKYFRYEELFFIRKVW